MPKEDGVRQVKQKLTAALAAEIDGATADDRVGGFILGLAVALDDTDKLKIFHDDAKALGVVFEPPDVNAGGYRFEPITPEASAKQKGERGRVRYDFGAIKGTGQGAIEAIVAALDRQRPEPFARPQGLALQADVTAARTDFGETYAVSVVKGGQNVITINAALPRNGQAYEGTWQVDVRDADVAPFAFGKPLPEFAAMGASRAANTLAAIDVLVSFEAVQLLRDDQGLSRQRLDDVLSRLDSDEHEDPPAPQEGTAS